MSDKRWKREGAAIIDEAGDVAALATTDEAQARIIRAVNCHDKLVAALSDLTGRVELVLRGVAELTELHGLASAARAALAECEAY